MKKNRGIHKILSMLLCCVMLLGFLPMTALPEPFTAKDLEAAVGIHRKSVQYSAVLKVLTAVGVTERVGLTSRRAYLYQVRIPNKTGHDYCRKRR